MPIVEEDIDGLSGLLFPFYDADTHMLYLAGKVRTAPLQNSTDFIFDCFNIFQMYCGYLYVEYQVKLIYWHFYIIDSTTIRLENESMEWTDVQYIHAPVVISVLMTTDAWET